MSSFGKSIVLGALLASHVAASDPAYPEQSWVAVRSARSTSGSTTARGIVGRVIFPAGRPRPSFVVSACQAGRVADPIGATISDINCDEIKTTKEGRFEIPVNGLSEKDSRWVTVTAPGYLPAGLLVESIGVEIDFLLVPEPPKPSR